jgi:hypothetical protein
VGFARAWVEIESTTPELIRDLWELRRQGLAEPGKEDKTEAELLSTWPPRHWRIRSLESNLEDLPAPPPPSG